MARRRRRKSSDGDVFVLLVLAGVLTLGGAALHWMQQNAVLAVLLGIAVVILVAAAIKRWWQRKRAFATTLAEFLAYSPSDFERAVANLLRTSGFRSMRQVGGSGDLSIDLVGRDQTGRTALVQCKRYAPGKLIGSPVIQQFYGMSLYRDPTARAIFVTTSDFTIPARDIARRTHIELISGTDLVAMAIRLTAQAESPDALVDAPEVPGSVGSPVPTHKVADERADP